MKIKQIEENRTPNDPYCAIKPYLVNENLRDLLGKILTIIDASVVDDKQNKSIKDLIKEKFSNKQDFFSEIAWYKLEEIPNNSDNGALTSLYDELVNGLVAYDYTKRYKIISK